MPGLIHCISGPRIPTQVVRVVMHPVSVVVAHFQAPWIHPYKRLSNEYMHADCFALCLIAKCDLRVPSAVDVLAQQAGLVIHNPVRCLDGSCH